MDFPILSLAFLLLFSAVFSSSEISFFSLSKVQLKELHKNRPNVFKGVQHLLDRPTSLIITLLIANESANVLISNILATYYSQHFTSWWVITIINICTALPLIVVICEITPRVIAAKANVRAVTFLFPAVWFLYRVTYPIRILIESFLNFVAKLMGVKSHRENIINEDDLLEAVSEGKTKGAVRTSEQELIKNVLELDDERAINLYVPVNEFALLLKEDDKVIDIIPRVLENKLSRVPVIRDFPNQIVGVLYTKDLLRYSHRTEEKITVKQLMKEAIFVDAGMKLDSLFRRMRQLHAHIVFATDKEKNVVGVITMEDVLGEIFTSSWPLTESVHHGR